MIAMNHQLHALYICTSPRVCRCYSWALCSRDFCGYPLNQFLADHPKSECHSTLWQHTQHQMPAAATAPAIPLRPNVALAANHCGLALLISRPLSTCCCFFLVNLGFIRIKGAYFGWFERNLMFCEEVLQIALNINFVGFVVEVCKNYGFSLYILTTFIFYKRTLLVIIWTQQ